MNNPTSLPPEAVQLLEKMHDIAEPGPISWWPLAWGWWLLIGGALTLIGCLVYWLQRRARQNRYRTEALRLLAPIKAQPSQFSVADLNEIVKRAALHAYPNERALIARSSGAQWVQWLNCKCKKPVLDPSAADALIQGAYRPGYRPPSAPLIDAARQWITQHRRLRPGQGGSHA